MLELDAPEEVSLNALLVRLLVFVSYLFSFIYIGIYWNNHHHLFQITQRVNGKILWANLHLLFWLSLIPFATAWIGINYIEMLPVITYGVILLFCAIAYFILQAQITKYHKDDFPLKRVVGSDRKGKNSIICYSMGVILSFVNTWFALALYAIVAVMWLVPDKRIEENI